MKNLNKYLVIFFVLFAASCASDIDNVRPSDSLEINDFFATASDFNAALGGAFQQMQNYYALELLIMGDIPTDNVIQSQTGRLSNDAYWDWRYTSLNDIGMLDEGYEAVNIANLIIKNIDVLPDGDAKTNILGQATAIRAIAHFDMARLYGPIPTESSDPNTDLGVAYLKFEDGDTGDPFALPARESVASNYTEIIGDLEDAIDLIGTAGVSTSVTNNFTVEALYGILSRVHLYNGDWTAAIDAANEVTSAPAPAADLLNVYRDASNAGILMKLGIDQQVDALSAGVVFSQSSSTNTISEYAMAYDLFSAIAADDIRGTAFVFTGVNEGNNYNAINKWIGETGQINGETDMPVIRVEEVLLNKAEAQFEDGQQAAALTTLNQLRDVRYTASSYTDGETGAQLEAAIRFERRLEMFAEYSRWFDIRRWGLGVNRANFGDFADGTGTAPQEMTLPAGDHRFLLPIPQTETNVNPNFGQNPGYGSGS
ncbi:RagB/SusD family nutrient uptake outer membrane protein [Ekhidna sp.]|uniref:RagB/SusD family nutrient uptake outer membrane protein n=1 Tax=Ekhidna sp. TaxID=2608089 RepID=UPI003B59ABBB